MKINVIRIHNELLGTYGDQGNAEVLEYRGRYLGITANIVDVTYKDSIPTNGDIYLLGGAEDAAQILSIEALHRDLETLNLVIERGAVVLAVCAGFQLLGNTFYADGKELKGLGLLDVDSIPGDRRFVGDIKTELIGMEIELTGFENHSGKTILGSNVEPLGRVKVGYGNGDGKFDGAVSGNIFGTYLHGPILARNPEFADLLLNRAIGRKFTTFEDPIAIRYANWRRKVTK
jgi:lipid II isoglutaminyl synthase (glutamine-hydrolysing)